jgi:hypothetical protein
MSVRLSPMSTPLSYRATKKDEAMSPRKMASRVASMAYAGEPGLRVEGGGGGGGHKVWVRSKLGEGQN